MRFAFSALLLCILVAPASARDSFEGQACDDHNPCTVDDRFDAGMCQGVPRVCDDGLPCTEDLCDPATGRCRVGLRIDACLISGACFGEGESHPQNPCLICRPSRNAQAWTETTTCDDGNPCTLDDRCVSGYCAGSAYICPGAGLCSFSRCDGKGGCTDEPLPGHCRIDGLCLREGQAHPTEPCLRCDPRTALDQWSVSTGTSCLGGTCIDGRCLATLVIERGGDGQGRVVGPGFVCDDDCVQSLVPERRIDMTVIAENGSVFQGWEGACSGVAPCTLSPYGQMRVRAIFEAAEAAHPAGLATLSVTHSGRGRVSGAGGRISCGSVCATELENGSPVTLTAEPASGYRFAGWEKSCRGPSLTCNTIVSGLTEVDAVFVPIGLP